MSVAVSLLVPREAGSTSTMRTFLKPEKGGLGRRPPSLPPGDIVRTRVPSWTATSLPAPMIWAALLPRTSSSGGSMASMQPLEALEY